MSPLGHQRIAKYCASFGLDKASFQFMQETFPNELTALYGANCPTATPPHHQTHVQDLATDVTVVVVVVATHWPSWSLAARGFSPTVGLARRSAARFRWPRRLIVRLLCWVCAVAAALSDTWTSTSCNVSSLGTAALSDPWTATSCNISSLGTGKTGKAYMVGLSNSSSETKHCEGVAGRS